MKMCKNRGIAHWCFNSFLIYFTFWEMLDLIRGFLHILDDCISFLEGSAGQFPPKFPFFPENPIKFSRGVLVKISH